MKFLSPVVALVVAPIFPSLAASHTLASCVLGTASRNLHRRTIGHAARGRRHPDHHQQYLLRRQRVTASSRTWKIVEPSL